MPYPVMNTLLDGGFPDGALNYWLSSFTRGLPDALIDTAVERFAAVPSPMTAILFEHFHGAVTRIGPTETAVPHREPGWNLLIPSVWTDPADTDANVRWTRETFAALQPHLADPPLAQLPRRRPGRRRHPRRLRPELRAAPRDQAPLRPRQRLPPQPQHRAVGRSRGDGQTRAAPAQVAARVRSAGVDVGGSDGTRTRGLRIDSCALRVRLGTAESFPTGLGHGAPRRVPRGAAGSRDPSRDPLVCAWPPACWADGPAVRRGHVAVRPGAEERRLYSGPLGAAGDADDRHRPAADRPRPRWRSDRA